MRRAAMVIAVTAFGVAGPLLSAQSTPAIDQLLDRMGAYLLEYETPLSSVVADERMEQEIVRLRGFSNVRRFKKLIESEISFIRLPGGSEWLGFRDVRKVNGQRLRHPGLRLAELLQDGKDVIAQGRIIASAGAAHNLGLPRTINVPTAPLEIVHPRHRAAFEYRVAESARVGRVATIVLTFVERSRPTIVRHPEGHDLVGSGRVWIEPASGRIRRIDWRYRLEERGEGAGPVPSLRVDFESNEAMGMLVPVRMSEVFAVPAADGRGTARNRNFRRFGTSARILPQP